MRREHLPLVAAKLPQIPRNAGPDGLGFAGPGFRALLVGLVPRLELRVGASFAGDAAVAVRAALQEAADLIAKMPATYMTFPNGGPVLPTTRRRAPPVTGEVVIDAAFLGGFGTLEVPRALWQALRRFERHHRPQRHLAAMPDGQRHRYGSRSARTGRWRASPDLGAGLAVSRRLRH